MKYDLKVPFAEKDEAKKIGAKWDAARKIWYVENPVDLLIFSRWSPKPRENNGSGNKSQVNLPVQQKSTGKVIVGSEYIAMPRVCDCLPWDDCASCRTDRLPA